MFPYNHQQIARIRQSEFLQEARTDRQLEQQIRAFFKRIGQGPVVAMNRTSKNFQVTLVKGLQKHDPISTD